MISKKKQKKGPIQICKRFSGRNRKFKRFFWPKSGGLQKKTKKRFSSQKRHEIRCQYTKNTNLGLDLHSSSPEPVNFSGAQSLLGGHNFRLGRRKQSFGGAWPRYAPPWRRVCLLLLQAKVFSDTQKNVHLLSTSRYLICLKYNSNFAQSWTALFRAFSSHRQPSASLTKLFPSWTRF